LNILSISAFIQIWYRHFEWRKRFIEWSWSDFTETKHF